MKKEMVFFLVMSSVSTMSVAMDNDKKTVEQKSPKQEPQCCKRIYAVPPCDKCCDSFNKKNDLVLAEKKAPQAPLPLSSSGEKERWLP